MVTKCKHKWHFVEMHNMLDNSLPIHAEFVCEKCGAIKWIETEGITNDN